MHKRCNILKSINQFKTCNFVVWFQTSDIKIVKAIYITIQPNMFKVYISYSEHPCGIMSYHKNKLLLNDCLFSHHHPPKKQCFSIFRGFFFFAETLWWELLFFFYFFIKLLEHYVVWLKNLFKLSDNSDTPYSTHSLVMIHITKNILKYLIRSQLKFIISAYYSLQHVSVDVATFRSIQKCTQYLGG